MRVPDTIKSQARPSWLTRWRFRARRIRQASWADRFLAAEAMVWLGLARFAVLIVPSSWLLARLGRLGYETPADDDHQSLEATRQIGRAIRRVSPHTPWLSNCLAQAVAAHIMLRRRNIASTLYLGVTRDTGRLEAHAFLRSGPNLITGGEGVERYTRVARFGWMP